MLIAMLIIASAGLFVRGAVPCDVIGDQPACLAALEPGPAVNALGRVIVGDSVLAFESGGELVLTTVQVDVNLTFGEWISQRNDPRVALFDRAAIVPPGRTENDVAAENAVLMDQSVTTSILAAFKELGYPDIVGRGARIGALSAPDQRSYAEGQIQVGDVVTHVNGTPVTDATSAVTLVRTVPVGSEVTLTIERANEVLTERFTLQPSPDDPERPLIGVSLQTAFDLPFDVDIDAGVIGGPSAGLFFALAIVDRLSEDDLTGGQIVAGTGTITIDGLVGPIGGIRQKVIGATERGDQGPPATVFLAPASQFEDAVTAAVTRQVLVVPVATLTEAIDVLRQLAAGTTPSGARLIGPATVADES